MKKSLAIFLAVVCALQTAAIGYLLAFTKPLKKDGGWWVFEGSLDEILRCNFPDSRGYLVVRSFPNALSGVTYFQAPEQGGRSYSIDIGLGYTSLSTAYNLGDGSSVYISDKDGDGYPELKSIKADSQRRLITLSFLEKEK